MFQDTLKYESGCMKVRMNSPNQYEKSDLAPRVIQIEKKLNVLLPTIIDQLNSQERIVNQLLGDNDLFRKIQQKLLDDIIVMKKQLCKKKEDKQKQQTLTINENNIMEEMKVQFSLLVEEKLEKLRGDMRQVFHQNCQNYHFQNIQRIGNPAISPPNTQPQSFLSVENIRYLGKNPKTQRIDQSPRSIFVLPEKQQSQQTSNRNTKYTSNSEFSKVQDKATEAYLNSLSGSKKQSLKQLNSIHRKSLMEDNERFRTAQQTNDLLIKLTTPQQKFILKSPKHQKTNSYENFAQLMRLSINKQGEHDEQQSQRQEQQLSRAVSDGNLKQIENEIQCSSEFSTPRESQNNDSINPIMMQLC